MTKSTELNNWLTQWSDQIHEWENETGLVFLGDNRIELTSRGRFERWLDKHNHKMELLRTVGSLTAALFSGAVLAIITGIIVL